MEKINLNLHIFKFLCIDLTDREKHLFAFSLTYAFIGWFLYVPWLKIEHTTVTMLYPTELLGQVHTDIFN